MKYKILHEKEPLEYGKYKLVSLREADIFDIIRWRNDQIDILRQKKFISNEEQMTYFEKVVSPSYVSEKPEIILLSYLENDKCIGYGGFVHIDWDSNRAEISFLLATDILKDIKVHCELFSIFLKMIKKIAFETIKFNKLTTETYDFRPWHIKILEKEGFLQEGLLKSHIKKGNKFYDAYLHGLLISNCTND